MNLITRRCISLALIGSLVGASAWAQQERGTRDEAKAMADAAYDHIKKVGPEKAYKDFMTDKAAWVRKDLYIQVCDGHGIGLAHGLNERLVGKDMSGLKDVNGVPIVGGLLAVAAKGGGWLDYDWPDPVTKKIMAKSSFARKLPSGDGFVAVGIYR